MPPLEASPRPSRPSFLRTIAFLSALLLMTGFASVFRRGTVVVSSRPLHGLSRRAVFRPDPDPDPNLASWLKNQTTYGLRAIGANARLPGAAKGALAASPSTRDPECENFPNPCQSDQLIDQRFILFFI
jgi:hypothetical protein